ncbi:MAG: alanyl-tRNA synthetase [Parcubacteria group bacterium Gr01-1014_38]|nr:MAG: alanyl-tRNA synthetase [Parcubacteria group bacterium Gr01-1014_38]
MCAITSTQLRERFLEFFRERGHAILPSASLVPENDPTVLFTAAGMQPLVPYLLGQPHPQGKRLANVQKCLRTGDIDEVGDAFHLTFFEMLGNWSLGDYFKKEAIEMSFEFLTSDRWLSLPAEKLAVTCFAGDADAPRDTESARIWERLGIPKDRMFFFGKSANWWGPPGKAGPCGPDTEIFFDTGRGPASTRPNDDSGRFVEIWNDVFMEYEKRSDGTFAPLQQKNVDTGMGLERAVAVLCGHTNVYETDVFAPLMELIRGSVPRADERHLRIAADHLRAAVFVLSDPHEIVPSNVEQGYVLRRLIRRALRSLRLQGAEEHHLLDIGNRFVDELARIYGEAYPEIFERKSQAETQLWGELQKYIVIEQRAGKFIEQVRGRGDTRISGAEAFAIYQESGIHPDLLRSLGASQDVTVDFKGFEEEFQKHQQVSRAGMTQRFAGGLTDHSERTVRMHTATHLLHEALRRILGPHVEQKGSNITPERLRFDFSHPRKLSTEEIRKVEDLVNKEIRRDLPVTRAVMTPEEAKAAGALGFFEEKYGDQVSVYTVGDFSKEICGGPHVPRTGVIGRFHITKEEGLAQGIRRIRAVVE